MKKCNDCRADFDENSENACEITITYVCTVGNQDKPDSVERLRGSSWICPKCFKEPAWFSLSDITADEYETVEVLVPEVLGTGPEFGDT